MRYRFVDFAMHRVRMLIHFGVTPYIVFDGDYLPSKASTEVARAEKRAESKRLGLELYRMGKPSQAHLELQKAVDVTPEMARQLIDELKRHDVQYVVAPYEADAQLVYLEKKGIIQGIISEDSDMLVFGAKRLLTKLDQYGECVEIHRDDFAACKEISLVGWSDAEFRRMAILSGCDYLANINKMGLKTAYRLVRKYKTIDRILQIVQLNGKYRVPPGYLDSFRKAELTFLHQRVFCPLESMLVMATHLDTGPEPEDLAFIGKHVEPGVALGVAIGDLHPMTKDPIVTVTITTRKHSEGSRTSTRRQTIHTPSDLKPQKATDSFFKPRRTPLAELDPNSFTPSPSQQRLLAQQTLTWSSSPVTSCSSLLRSTTSLPSSSRLTMPSDAEAISNTTNLPGSIPYPSKRQRLCHEDSRNDDMLPSGSAKVELGRSRFFTPSVPDPSPSNRRNGRNKIKASAINIWSDESIEDVMLGLPDVSEGSTFLREPKLNIHQDKQSLQQTGSTFDDVVPSEISQSSMSTASTLTQSSATPVSRISSSISSNTLLPISILATDHKVVNDTITAHSIQPGDKSVLQEKSLAHAEPRKPLFNAVFINDAAPQALLTRHNSTGTLYRSRDTSQESSKSASLTSSFGYTSKSRNLQSFKMPASRFDVPQSPEPVKRSSVEGSEDLLVANSEDELDGQSVSEVDDTERPKLCLGQFAFAG